jgi:hypothetical protein
VRRRRYTAGAVIGFPLLRIPGHPMIYQKDATGLLQSLLGLSDGPWRWSAGVQAGVASAVPLAAFTLTPGPDEVQYPVLLNLPAPRLHSYPVYTVIAGFIDARECIKDLQEKGFSKDSPQYYALLVGLVCLYARPFTTAEQIGTLSDNIVPAKFRELHKELLRLRNEMFAHTDPAALLPGATPSSNDFASGIVFRYEHKSIYVIPSRFHADPQFLPDFILPLLDALIEITGKKRKQLHDTLAHYVPKKVGDYELNVLDIDKPVFKRVPAVSKIDDRFQ